MTARKLRVAVAGYAVAAAATVAALVPVLAADLTAILAPRPVLNEVDLDGRATRTPVVPKVVPADPVVDAAFDDAGQ